MSATVIVQGQKFETDSRGARALDTLKVGDSVKLLKKNSYSTQQIFGGVIVAIDLFKSLPTVVVIYLPGDNTGEVGFAYINAETKDFEVVPAELDPTFPSREMILSHFERAIERKHTEIANLVSKREYFLRNFGTATLKDVNGSAAQSEAAVA